MIKKKICLIGSFGVGKTSLVSRYAKGIFSEKYLSTVGVMISQKSVHLASGGVRLMIWDLAGEDDFQGLRLSYLKGASGALFVADGTREETLQITQQHIERMEQFHPGIPALILLNKADLNDQWEISDDQSSEFDRRLEVFPTSAKTGANVVEAFERLATIMVESNDNPASDAFL